MAKANVGEYAAYTDVRDVAHSFGASVHMGTKLSDVTDPTLAGDDYDWATRAHIDLLIRDDDEALTPLFAIEVDRSAHTKPDRARRDRRKDHLLKAAGIDVLRVTTQTALRRHGPGRMAAYLASIWFLARWFYSERAEGRFPPDESFWHTSVIIPDGQGGGTSFYPTMQILHRFHGDANATGTPVDGAPQAWIRTRADVGLVDARTVLALTDELFLYAEATIGHIDAYGIQNRDIAEEVTLFDLDWQYTRWRDHNEAVGRHIRDLPHLLPAEARLDGLFRADTWFPNGGSSIFNKWLVNAVGTTRARDVYPLYLATGQTR